MITYGYLKDHPESMTLNPAGLEFQTAGSGYSFIVGMVFQQKSDLKETLYFVGSPNRSELPPYPLQEVRKVRLRKNLNFGLEDPLSWPQPFHPSTPHLATIPKPGYPGLSDTFKVVYLAAGTHGCFTVRDAVSGLGTFACAWEEYYSLQVEMEQEVAAADTASIARDAMNPCLPSVDGFVKGYLATATSSITKLRLLSTENEMRLLIKTLQRIFLELKARLLWLMVYFPKGEDKHGIPSSTSDLLVGAYTSKQSFVRRFHVCRIPCYYVETIQPTKYTAPFPHRVQINIAGYHDLQHNDMLGNLLEDAEPPFEVIWTGPFTKLERYQSMRLWLATQYRSVRVRTGSDPVPSTSGTDRSDSSPSTSKSRFRPYRHNRPSCGNSSQAPNIWIPANSSLMPTPLPNWLHGLQYHSELNLSAYPLEGLNAGYAVPDGNLIARASTALQPRYVHTWLQLRTVMLYRLTSSRASQPLASKAWKAILGKHKISRSNTARSRVIAATEETLEDIIRQSHLATSISISNLLTAPACWKDIHVSDNSLPPEIVVREILWELTEVNFRHDFLALDSLETADIPDRQEQVERLCWPDPPSHPQLDDINQTLASNVDEVHYRRLKGFFMVVREWQCAKDLKEFKAPFPEFGNNEHLGTVERCIAKCYVGRFYHYFGRPACIPYKL